MKNPIALAITSIISIATIALIFKGSYFGGVIEYQKNKDTAVGSPFELSNSTARYALTKAIVENNTFFLNEDLASFSSPDVVETNGKYLSIFTPGISFLGVPFYIAGKALGLPQLVTYLLNSLALIVDVILIAILARKLGAKTYSSIVSGLVFGFATNALTYSQTFAQHIISSGILVGLILLATNRKSSKAAILAGAIYGLGVLVDFPNAIMGLPMVLHILKNALKIQNISELRIEFNWKPLLFILGVTPLILTMAYYNFVTTGSFMKLAQSIGRTDRFNIDQPIHKLSESPEVEGDPKGVFKLSSILPFNTRRQMNGLYTLVVSPERAWLYYSPIVILGIAGLIIALRKPETKDVSVLGFSVAGICLLVYSSFGDPWGGWAFGPRYLIPTAAVFSAGLGILVERFKRNIVFWIIFVLLLIYSVANSVLGALTTNAIPPQVEAESLPNPIPYTQEYNWELLETGLNTSLVYSILFAKEVDPEYYLYAVTILITLPILTFGLLSIFEKKNEQ